MTTLGRGCRAGVGFGAQRRPVGRGGGLWIETGHAVPSPTYRSFSRSPRAAWAAARRAIGVRKGEQLT